jgi:hypothetical protein
VESAFQFVQSFLRLEHFMAFEESKDENLTLAAVRFVFTGSAFSIFCIKRNDPATIP